MAKTTQSDVPSGSTSRAGRDVPAAPDFERDVREALIGGEINGIQNAIDLLWQDVAATALGTGIAPYSLVRVTVLVESIRAMTKMREEAEEALRTLLRPAERTPIRPKPSIRTSKRKGRP